MTNERQEFDRDSIPQHVRDILESTPPEWDDPAVKINHTINNQPGLLPILTEGNPGLAQSILNFYLGNQSILVVGGESGMGKSLLLAELKLLNSDLKYVLSQDLQPDLRIIGWDRAHRLFYDQIGDEFGRNVGIPKGETGIKSRHFISEELRDNIRRIKNTNPKAKILVETPLIGSRGNLVVDRLPEYKDQMQVLIMHSPELRREIIDKGERINEDSNPIKGIEEMRETFMEERFGSHYKRLPRDSWDSLIYNDWQKRTFEMNGMVVVLDPDWDRYRFMMSELIYQRNGIHPDEVTPADGRVMRLSFINRFDGMRGSRDYDEIVQDAMDSLS